MQELIGVAMVFQEGIDLGLTKTRPAMTGEHDIAIGPIEAGRLAQILGPGLGITYQGAARRQDIVHGDIGVFGHAEDAHFGQKDVHFRRRFGARCDLEL